MAVNRDRSNRSWIWWTIAILVVAGLVWWIASATGDSYDYGALESEVATLRGDYDTLRSDFDTYREEWGTFNEEWGVFRDDWGLYREEVGLGE